jgi:hypothetical protein
MAQTFAIEQSKTIPARDILPFFEIPVVLMRFDHVAMFIADRMAAHRKLDQHRVYLYAGGLRKRA